MIGEYYQKENGIIGNGGGNSNKKITLSKSDFFIQQS